MPIRIYALAKDLQIDSKELVDICTKAGIPGKGSALASLNDDEEVRVKAYLASTGVTTSPAAPAEPVRTGGGLKVGRSSGGLRDRMGAGGKSPVTPSAPITRDDYIGPSHFGSKIKVIGTRRGSGLKQPPATTEELPAEVGAAPPEAPPAAAEPPVTAASAAAPVETPPVAPLLDVPEREPPLLRPTEHADVGSIKIIGGPRKRPDAGERRPKRRTPIINVAPAPMPEAKQPAAAKKEEPKTQKPEIRLPKEALTLRKGQRRPPLEHLTEKKPKKDKEPKRAAHVAPFDDEAPATAARRGGPPAGRRGVKTAETPDVGMAGMASARADRKARRATRKVKSTTLVNPRESEPQAPRKRKTLIHKGTNTAAPRKGKVALELPCTVRSFSEAAGVSVMQVQKALIGLGQMLTINSVIESEYVELLATELGVDLEFKAHETLEDALITKIRDTEDSPEELRPRPPVVTFLGPRRSRQDLAPRLSHRHQRGGRRSGRHHAAHSRLPDQERRPGHRLCRHARSRSLHRNAGPRGTRHRYRRAGRGGR